MGRAILLLTLMGAMLFACTGVVLAQSTTPSSNQPSTGQANAHIPVCPGPVSTGTARCHSHVVTSGGTSKPTPNATTSPTGLTPLDLQTAYNVAAPSDSPTVAIVDAYDDPTAESDLGVFSKQFGLPDCTTANGCFKKVNQRGGNTYPRKDSGWALEISLDVQTVHAVCPKCKILLVEADTNSLSNLSAAVDYAASVPGVVAISNSYGGNEYSGETGSESHYNHPGHAITASSGDNGYGVSFPAASGYVTAVGGTTLNVGADHKRTSETTWNGSGSGCSAYVSKPSWQTDSGCGRRTVADVSADADPATGMSVYDSTVYQGQKGWFKVGGTSLSAPIIATLYAVSGNATTVDYGSYPYNHASSLFDIVSGSNGNCSGSYLCTAGTGYDGPTGLGSPNGNSGF